MCLWSEKRTIVCRTTVLSVHRLSVLRFSMFRMMIVRVLRKSYRIYVTSSAQIAVASGGNSKFEKKRGPGVVLFDRDVGRPIDTLSVCRKQWVTSIRFFPFFFLFFLSKKKTSSIQNFNLSEPTPTYGLCRSTDTLCRMVYHDLLRFLFSFFFFFSAFSKHLISKSLLEAEIYDICRFVGLSDIILIIDFFQ